MVREDYRKGDVILAAFHFVKDGIPEVRNRPGVIVSNDFRNASVDDVLVVPIAAESARDNFVPSTVWVKMGSEAGRRSGLSIDSIIDCSVLVTVQKRLIVSKIGQFPDETMREIDDLLRAAIDPERGYSAAGVPLHRGPTGDDTGMALELPEPENSERDK